MKERSQPQQDHNLGGGGFKKKIDMNTMNF